MKVVNVDQNSIKWTNDQMDADIKITVYVKDIPGWFNSKMVVDWIKGKLVEKPNE